MGKDLTVAVLPPIGAGGAAAAATNSPASVATGADRPDTATQVLCTGRDRQENEGGSLQGLGAKNEGHKAAQTLLKKVALAAAAAVAAAVVAACPSPSRKLVDKITPSAPGHPYPLENNNENSQKES